MREVSWARNSCSHCWSAHSSPSNWTRQRFSAVIPLSDRDPKAARNAQSSIDTGTQPGESSGRGKRGNRTVGDAIRVGKAAWD